MKVVYVNDVVYGYATEDPSANGGAERYGWLLMRALANAGWSVTVGVYVLREKEVQIIDGVRFIGIRRRAHFLLDWYWLLDSERPDLCFWQNADHLWGPMVEIARWLGVQTAWSTMHDLDVQPRKALMRRPNWWFLHQWGLRRSNIIFLQHSGQRDFLPAAWHSKTFVLPGIVSLPGTVIPHSQRNGTVAWVAVIRPPKRPDILLGIARRLPMIRFIVCGAPSPGFWWAGKEKDLERIMTQLQSLPNVDYRGHVAPAQVLKVIGESNLLLSTSDGEGFPSVFLEAWAAGTPVVSLQIDPDYKIRNGGLGMVTGTVEGSSDAVITLMASDELRYDMGIRARQHVEEIHSPASAVRAFEDAVKSVHTDQKLPVV
ncbi:MAG TPA: glycosyltransferase family 4 protein [Nitrospira sp.]|nr:glycosyltransferase family 4 protein [Nitrospira sp.]